MPLISINSTKAPKVRTKFLALAFLCLALALGLSLAPWAEAAAAVVAECPPRQNNLAKTMAPAAIFIGVLVGFIVLSKFSRRRLDRKFQALLASIEPGDGVVTYGGFCSVVVAVEPQGFIVALDSGAKAHLIRDAVASVVKLKDDRPDLDPIKNVRSFFPKI
ncbi:MAG: preprotein translocase subunit YajC [Deltaproteobacteria bacterium]|jgi:preprotein translocase subunit YajC|nr:preprotein translocase subunit YajC [Deltaproteobacteria bacterium]